MTEKSIGDVSRIDLEMLHAVSMIALIAISECVADLLEYKMTWKVDDILEKKLEAIVAQINSHLEMVEKVTESSQRDGWIKETVQASNRDN